MALALSVTAIVIVALLWEVALPHVERWVGRRKAARRRVRPDADGFFAHDPGRELRAEQRARTLLKSCVNEEEWEMYRDLGFIRVWGVAHDGPEYAYLIYPHKPLVSYLAQTSALLSEYCVEFPDETRPYGSPMLPDSDDVLAKWMALTGDERRLIASANMHLPGRQVDPKQVRRDLWRLSQWERRRLQGERRSSTPA